MPLEKSTGARSSFKAAPIGVVKDCYKSREEAPRQGIDSQKICRIEIFSKYARALEGIEEGQELVVLCWMHLARRDVLYSETRKRGIFATRSPERPNPIAVSVVKVVRIQKNVLHVKHLDAISGTPVLDIKPHFLELDFEVRKCSRKKRRKHTTSSNLKTRLTGRKNPLFQAWSDFSTG